MMLNDKSCMLRYTAITVLYCLLLIMMQLTNTKLARAASRDNYSIVLASAPGSQLEWSPKQAHELEGYTLFVTATTLKGANWERLNMGFFSSQKQASSKLDQIKYIYPGAWVKKTDPSEQRRILVAGRLSKPASASSARKPGLTDEQLDSLMQRSKTEIKKKNYSQAIRYLTALVEAGEHKYSPEALELLGLARQRKGQNAHAVAIYEQYLEKYPENEGARRVKQRISGILTASQPKMDKVSMESEPRSSRLSTFGSFSQFYLKDQATSDDIGTISTLSQLVTYFDLTTVYETLDYDHRFQITVDDTRDFLEDDNDDAFRFIETYYDLGLKRTGSSAWIGRQTLRIGGVIQRFDGISAGYQFTPGIRLNVLGGYPVEINNRTSINQHKTFYGFTFETGTFLQNWDMNLFYFDQSVDGIDDRTSAGTEVRYRDNRTSVFGMIDYDLLYKELNILQLNANLFFDQGKTLYMNAFMRKTPLLSTSNALIGRQESSIEELKQTLNVEQIYQLARDRTADSETITFGGSQPLSEKYQVLADITLSRVGATIESGDVSATQESGTDYFLNTQLVGNNIFMFRDTGVLGFRYLDTMISDTFSFIVNTRFPISRNWRINPRLQYDLRELSDGRSQNKIRALLKTDYNYFNKARFDFELGYDDTSESGTELPLGNSYLYFLIGYRIDF